MNHHVLLYLAVPIFLSFGCAGPTNPWGNYGLSLPSHKLVGEDHLQAKISEIPQQESKATASFYPDKQNLTELSQFSIIIDNKELIERDFKLQLFYNQYDVTDTWLRNSKITFNHEYSKIKVNFSALKLLPDTEHDILVKFQNDPYTKAKYYRFEEPECSLSAYSPLRKLSPFRVSRKLKASIESISKESSVNPRFIAGLIAQESAFNDKAVSHAKAIGLTQVTNLAQTHVLENNEQWPTNKAVTEYSVPIIKTMILTGALNPDNEWRLNHDLSIQGGITFLKYLENYWQRPEHRKLIRKYYGDNMEIINDLILASYNSGAYRVKKALMRHGRLWIKDSDQLNEARKYIKKVKSYCYHFEDELAPRTAWLNN